MSSPGADVFPARGSGFDCVPLRLCGLQSPPPVTDYRLYHFVMGRSQHVIGKVELVLEWVEALGAAAEKTRLEGFDDLALALDFTLRGFEQKKHLIVLF